MSKFCTKCNIEKDILNFNKNRYECRDCQRIYKLKYRHTIKGLLSKIYSSQKETSIKRHHVPPSYTLEELTTFILKKDNFNSLFINWEKSNFNKMLVPSMDRINDYLPYTLNNILLTTWQENKNKYHREHKNGINNKASVAVIGINKNTGKTIEFYSISKASRDLNIHLGNIWDTCAGNRASAGGYYWKYK